MNEVPSHWDDKEVKYDSQTTTARADFKSEDRYEQALERAKKIKEKIMYSHLSTESCKAVEAYIDEIIPELAESEDEKELVLTWEDMVRIDNILGDMEDEYSKKMPEGMTNEKFYREVLKRFNKAKEEKK